MSQPTVGTVPCVGTGSHGFGNGAAEPQGPQRLCGGGPYPDLWVQMVTTLCCPLTFVLFSLGQTSCWVFCLLAYLLVICLKQGTGSASVSASAIRTLDGQCCSTEQASLGI